MADSERRTFIRPCDRSGEASPAILVPNGDGAAVQRSARRARDGSGLREIADACGVPLILY